VTVYLDTNVLVAAVLPDHLHHAAAKATLRKIRGGKMTGCLAAHGLAELYAVLTRLPLTPPVYPAEALRILERDVLPWLDLTTLTGEEYLKTLRSCAAAGWAGGRIYDALHVAAARKASCRRIYTFNVGHFRELAPDLKDRIVAPSA
jgi:predicted nucleic acid-binding protein